MPAGQVFWMRSTRLLAGLLVGLSTAVALAPAPATVADPGPNDPCIRVRDALLDTGEAAGLDCRSYVCVVDVNFGAIGNGCRINRVSPGGTTLEIQLLWFQGIVTADWRFRMSATDQATGESYGCPDWAGAALVDPALPGDVPTCSLVGQGPWATNLRQFEFLPVTDTATLGVYVGPPRRVVQIEE